MALSSCWWSGARARHLCERQDGVASCLRSLPLPVCRAALAAQPPLKPPTPHEAGTLLLLANQRRLFFEQNIGLATFAEAAQLSAYGELVRTPLVLGAQHFQAIHRTLLQPESRLLAALAASLRCTLAPRPRAALSGPTVKGTVQRGS